MTAFSLRLTNGANAVSKLHAVTANSTWQRRSRRPILGVTNGVHPPTWVGEPFARAVRATRRRPRPARRRRPAARFWERMDRIPDDELWEAHQRQKLELAFFARRRLQSQFARHGESPASSTRSTRRSTRAS